MNATGIIWNVLGYIAVIGVMWVIFLLLKKYVFKKQTGDVQEDQLYRAHRLAQVRHSGAQTDKEASQLSADSWEITKRTAVDKNENFKVVKGANEKDIVLLDQSIKKSKLQNTLKCLNPAPVKWYQTYRFAGAVIVVVVFILMKCKIL